MGAWKGTMLLSALTQICWPHFHRALSLGTALLLQHLQPKGSSLSLLTHCQPSASVTGSWGVGSISDHPGKLEEQQAAVLAPR